MLKIEPIKPIAGFGFGGANGEYYYSQGMTKSRFGLVPGWHVISSATASDLPTLNLVNWLTQGTPAGVVYVTALDSQGYIYRSELGLLPWTLHYRPDPGVGHGYSGNGC